MADYDFSKLYAALGLQPGFTLDEFKRAYRRQVAALHPDQQAGGPDMRASAALAELQEINRLYDAAMDFHRVHGRMPGMQAPRPRAAAAPVRRPSASARPAPAPPSPSPPAARAVAEKPFPLRYVLLIAVMVAVVYGIERNDSSQPDAAASHAASKAGADDAAPEPARNLVSLGMRVDEVLEIQGTPLSMHEERLDYGPSWVALRCGRVSDWYSSPLRPLHVEATAPTVEARDMLAELLPSHC